MSIDNSSKERVLLSQDEMDRVLHSISKEVSDNKDVVTDVPALSQSELDALFSSSTIMKEKPKKLERPKSISVVCARGKWTKEYLQNLKVDAIMDLDTLENECVEILSDGHCIAHGIMVSSGVKKAVRIVSVENDTE